MTDDEARAILADCGAWIDDGDEWETGIPDWAGGKVHIDGCFSVAELRAILHFGPKDSKC